MAGRGPGPNPPPPPPPPAPARQGGGGGGGGGPPPFIRVDGGGPPRPDIRPPGPPPPPAGFQPPPRQPIQSTRVVDITPRKPLDEDSCRKRMTNYEAYIIRKIVPRDSKEKSTWAKSEITKEALSQEDIIRAVRKLNESRRSVHDKKNALMRFQQGQVTRLIDELMTHDNDTNFEWSLAQLDPKTFTNKKGQKETSTITVYMKRAPLKDLNPIGLFNAIERNKQVRLEQMNRPPPRPEPARGSDPNGVINVGEMGRGNGRNNGGGPRRLNRPKKKYHDHSSASSQYSSSDSESDSEYSSDGHTTISTHSARHSRRYKNNGRNQSRRREHRRKYYVDERILSPERRLSLPYRTPRYVPDVPSLRQPALDPVAAAYQAGRVDAGAERLSLDRYHRRSLAEPAAIVSYERPFERLERVYSEPIRYIDRGEDVRYFDDREEEYLRRDERRRREAEEYMDRRF